MANKSEQIKSQVGIEIRGNSIRIIFYYQDKMCRETVVTGTTKSDINYAVRRRAEVLRKIEDEEFNYKTEFPNSKQALKFESKKPTCRELLNNLIERYEKGSKKPITKRVYITTIKHKLIPYFGDFFITDITPSLIKQYVNQFKLSRTSINHALMHLRVILDYALNDGIIKDQPLKQLALDKLIDDVAINSEHEVLPLTKDEQDKLLKSCSNPLIRNAIILAINTGLRIGELIALRWDNVYYNHIYVTENMVKGNLGEPKTKPGIRKVLLLPKAKEALDQLRLITGEYTHVLISFKTKNPWQNSTTFWYHWNKAIKLAGIKYREPYQCRHTYASTLLSNGENPL